MLFLRIVVGQGFVADLASFGDVSPDRGNVWAFCHLLDLFRWFPLAP
jgi:hypothetical protein